jgi:uncharacterized protein YpmS
MNQKRLVNLIILTTSLATMLACTFFIGGPDYPDRTIPVSTEAVGDLQTSIQQAIAIGAVSGQVTVTITEAQLTSYLAMKLGQQSDPLLSNPQVYLQDGQIQLYGTAKQGYFQATAAIILTAGIDETGQLTIELTSADFGPMPVPDGLLSIITAMVEEAFTGAVGPAATGIRLTSITVANGLMIVTGQIK